MLILGSRLLNSPIMSLQTGSQLASTLRPIIDPSTLRILAYEVEGPLLTEKPSFLRIDDIREYGRLGMIIDGTDELIGLDDVIKIKEVYSLNFSLVGLNVIDTHKQKLGKITDYTLDTGDFLIQQLNVKRGLFRGITDTGLLINRSQIVEVNDTSVIVRAPSIKNAEPLMQSLRTDFVNPFRTQKPHVESSTPAAKAS
ncbi:MAG: PRC-barrel domain-containing protein [Candidatus Microsaccharimonas sp.]